MQAVTSEVPTIVVLPEYYGSNAYIQRVREIVAPLGKLESFQGRARFRGILQGRAHRVDYLIVSWLDNELISNRSGRASLSGMVRFVQRVALFKLLARKVIFVRHNMYPHSARHSRSAKWVEWLLDRLERLFDAVIVHSGAHRTGAGGLERRYVPHPLYLRSKTAPSRPASDGLPERYFLAFGRIARYKNLESLMRAFPDDQNLVVCGEMSDREYAALLSRIRRPNIYFRPGLLSEEDAQAMVNGAQAVVLAHAEPNVLVSGTLFYAMSMRRPVFAVRTPFLNWLAPRVGADVLSLAENVEDLCLLVRTAPCAPLSDRSVSLIEKEFGDEAVRSSLAEVMAIERR